MRNVCKHHAILNHFERQSSYINYVEAFLIAPGDIDLTNLKFSTAGDSVMLQLDDDDDLAEPGNGGTIDSNEPGGEEDGDDGNRHRRRADEGDGEENKNDDVVLYGTQVDVAVFHLVSTFVTIQSWSFALVYSQIIPSPSN